MELQQPAAQSTNHWHNRGIRRVGKNMSLVQVFEGMKNQELIGMLGSQMRNC